LGPTAGRVATPMTDNAVLTGGPGDGKTLDSGLAVMIEIEIDRVAHRYIRTTQQQADGGRELNVFAYDGAVDPAHAQDGTEHVATGSPLRRRPIGGTAAMNDPASDLGITAKYLSEEDSCVS